MYEKGRTDKMFDFLAIYVVESPDIFAAEGSTPKQEKSMWVLCKFCGMINNYRHDVGMIKNKTVVERARVSLEFTAEITENPEGCMLGKSPT